MKPNQNNDWILTEIEFALCANMLGNETWGFIPVVEREQSLEQRMLDGVFHLAEKGLLNLEENGKLQPTELMLERMVCIIWPERMIRVVGKGRLLWQFFQRGDICFLVEPVLAEKESYRIIPVKQKVAEMLLESLTEVDSISEQSIEEKQGDVDTVESLEKLLEGAMIVLMVEENGEEAMRAARILLENGHYWLTAQEIEGGAVPLNQKSLEEWLDR